MTLAAAFARSARRFPRRTAVTALTRILFAQQDLPGEFHAVLIVDGDHFDLQVIADLADVIDAIDVLVIQLADMAKTFAAGQDLDKRPEILDRSDPAIVDLADTNFLG